VLAGVTSQAEKTMGENAALQIIVKLTLHIRRQACGIGIGIERGEKGFKMFCNHFIEDRVARIPWFAGGNSRRHESTLRTASRVWR
jgi:hypothetical protein